MPGPGGGAAPRGVCVCLVPGGLVRVGGGAWWRSPPDGYCCGRYASYANAFLFRNVHALSFSN